MKNKIQSDNVSTKYEVKVDDMFDYMDESRRYTQGVYETLEEAIHVCVSITLESLNQVYEQIAEPKNRNPETLREGWCAYGDDPWISGPGSGVPFSARSFMTDGLLSAIIHSKRHEHLSNTSPGIDGATQHGLVKCQVCGEYKGKVQSKYLNWATPLEGDEGEEFVDVSCICEGIPCAKCKKNKIHRPISNPYNEEDNSIGHAPYFVGMMPCSECREKE